MISEKYKNFVFLTIQNDRVGQGNDIHQEKLLHQVLKKEFSSSSSKNFHLHMGAICPLFLDRLPLRPFYVDNVNIQGENWIMERNGIEYSTCNRTIVYYDLHRCCKVYTSS